MKIIEWDGNSLTANYAAALMDGSSLSLPVVRGQAVGRLGRWPLVGGIERPGRVLTLGIAITAAAVSTARASLLRWFDPEDETPKKLSATDDDGSSNERYVYAVCESLQAQPSREGGALGQLYVATLRIHGDVRWRHETEDTQTWTVTSSGDTEVVANGGTDDAYPRLTIKPTTAKTGGYAYKRWVPVRWRVTEAFENYPYELTNGGLDTAALVTASKAQADGDDFRVWVDGSETYRWFGASGTHVFNQTATYVWANLSFQANVAMTLKTAIASTGALDEIEVNEAITALPATGILLIGTEAFVYTGKNDASRQVTGITRAARGTSMAAHAVDDDVYWIQHDIWLMYGNASAAAPASSDLMLPAFNLDSTNTSWDYDVFGDGTYPAAYRTGRWSRSSPHCYTDEEVAYANPWAEMGCKAAGTAIHWTLYNPCGLTAANFANGEKQAAVVSLYNAKVRVSETGSEPMWYTEYTIPDPSVAATFEAWSWSDTIDAVTAAKYVQLWLGAFTLGTGYYVEVADVTVTLNSSYTPTTAFMGAEQGNYLLDCTITNNTTGDAIEVLHVMALDEELEVDTYEKTVVDLQDDSQQMQALTLVGGARRNWLRLQPGNNTLKFEDTGTVAVTVEVEWAERFYG